MRAWVAGTHGTNQEALLIIYRADENAGLRRGRTQSMTRVGIRSEPKIRSLFHIGLRSWEAFRFGNALIRASDFFSRVPDGRGATPTLIFSSTPVQLTPPPFILILPLQ